ncbi:MAG: thioesterase family protein [Anaerolineae bacterium]|nr:thioesterase family protein [Anaerolineae bacterium]
MPRIKLHELPHYEFCYEVTLQVRDINYGGHLGNDALVGLLHEARINLLNRRGCSEMNLGDGQTGIIMADLAVNFKEEGFMLDRLQIDSHIGELSRRSFRIFHRITKGGSILALAETGFVAFNYATRAIAPVPAAFIEALNNER